MSRAVKWVLASVLGFIAHDLKINELWSGETSNKLHVVEKEFLYLESCSVVYRTVCILVNTQCKIGLDLLLTINLKPYKP